MSYGMRAWRANGSIFIDINVRTFWIAAVHSITMNNAHGQTRSLFINNSFQDGTWGWFLTGNDTRYIKITETATGLYMEGLWRSWWHTQRWGDATNQTFKIWVFRF